MSSTSEAVAAMKANETAVDLEAVFRAQYGRIARVIARVVRDSARAEELAVEVFLKLSRHPQARGDKIEGWLYRTAIRIALDELRRQTRRSRYELLAAITRKTPTPEEIRASTEEQERVRLILSVIDRRGAELLLLRSQGFSYDELADALSLNPGSIGTLLSRAQQIFRKEYFGRYGNPDE